MVFAFFGTSLASTLTAAAVDTVGDRDPGPHDANLFDMQEKYADVVTADQVVRHLQAHRGRTRNA